MINKSLSFLLCLLLVATTAWGQSRSCGAYTNLQHSLQQSQDEELYISTRSEILEHAVMTNYESRSNDVYRIPVVFHVVYYLYDSAAQNISDSLIHSQIEVLNEDFRRLNPDTFRTRSVFKPIATDAKIEFVLANRDPSFNSTSGINRTATTRPVFTLSDEVKSSATGGADPWNSHLYLNVWICNLQHGEYLGYATFPGQSQVLDGIVLHYENVGFNPNGSHFDRGRTATHEVGHWLGLYHIWGDDDGECSGSDQIVDTPNQADHSVGCPSATQPTSCNSLDMFENYMDYTYDGCVNMFTADQVSVMRSTIEVVRWGNANSPGFVGIDKISTEEELNILILPNPVIDNLTVKVKPNSAPIEFLELKTLKGEVVSLVSKPFVANFARTFDLTHLSPGIYLLSIGTIESRQMIKIVKL